MLGSTINDFLTMRLRLYIHNQALTKVHSNQNEEKAKIIFDQKRNAKYTYVPKFTAQLSSTYDQTLRFYWS